MLKKLCASIFCAGLTLAVFGQDSLSHKRYYVGIQANQLIRQLLNFSGSGSAVNNPYLLTVSINNAQTGWGSNFGWGYTYNQLTDGDAFTQRKTTINDFFFRIGFERKRRFGKKWVLSAGVDAVLDLRKNTTETTNQTNLPQSDTKTVSKNNGGGLGPRITLNYEVTEKILLGTEATYYFKSIENKEKNTGPGSTNDETSETLQSFQLNVPAVLFLILKF